MKKTFTSRSAFFNPRVLSIVAFCATGVLLALVAFALYSGGNALAQARPLPAEPAFGVAPPAVSAPLTPGAGLAEIERQPAPVNRDGDFESRSGTVAAPFAAPFTFENTGSLPAPARHSHTATLLHNGKVLVAGGLGENAGGPGTGSHSLSNAELYDPANGNWRATGSLHTARYSHTATLLPNGKVLVAGGSNNGAILSSAELYDPANGSWTTTGSLHAARAYHTMTLLPNGKVLVAGGFNNGFLTSAELYDPTSGSWTFTGSLHTIRFGSTATLLPNGKVLVAGGFNGAITFFNTAELYDPASGTWTVTGSLNTARAGHSATLLPDGRVLVAGGGNGSSGSGRSAELYDPASGTWTATGSLNTARAGHSATLLPNGKVLAAGGGNDATADLYDSASGSWTVTGSLNTARAGHSATLLPNGKVLVVGGLFPSGYFLTSAELFDPASGSWTATGSLTTGRYDHTATLLPSGRVLVAGGYHDAYLTSAELYDPASGSWMATGSLNTGRYHHTATLLPNGKVLVAGGTNFGALSSAELYDPASGSWTATGSLNTGRYHHTATLLPNGKVLVAGGVQINGVILSNAELYDPATGSWTATGSLNTSRYDHTATLLPNGKVLVAGGFNFPILTSAELYDPASGSWTVTGSLNTARYEHTATLLPTGKVLVAGGFNLTSAELYDPASGSWTATGSLNSARINHTATLLPNGKVLAAGGFNINGGSPTSAELYEPASGSWTATGSLNTGREFHSATLLTNGRVLVAVGFGFLTSAELYDVGLGFVRPDWQPQITAATSPLITGGSLMLTGSRFQGISQASGGNNQDSSTNYPVVQLRSIDNSQVAFLLVDPVAGWSDTTFTSSPVSNFPPGPALVTVFTNGIPSDSKYLVIGGFIKAININGNAETINGNQWTSYADALATGFATSNPVYGTNITYSPAVDAPTSRILNTGIWCPACDVNFSQILPNGNYEIYLWAVENFANNYRSYNVKLEGVQVAAAIGSLPLNTWQRIGPYSVTVSDGTLNVNLGRITGDPLVQGVEIWSPAPTPPPETFVKAININGNAETINGNLWTGYNTALANGFATSNAPYSTNITYSPAVDDATNRMLNTGIWCPACDVNFSQTITNGNYVVYLWGVENFANSYRSYNVKLEGAQVAAGIGNLVKNTWQRYGPYNVTVNDGTLNVNLVRVTGDPLVQGVEIWSTAPPPTPTPSPAFLKAVNINGNAETINGNSWTAYNAALGSGFATSNSPYSTNIGFIPPVDAATNRMLNTGIWCPACDINFSQTISNGNYLIYLWGVENFANNYRSYNVKLEGAQVANGIGNLPLNGWQKYGPYSVTVSDGTLNVNLVRVTGDPLVQGVEIWSAGGP